MPDASSKHPGTTGKVRFRTWGVRAQSRSISLPVSVYVSVSLSICPTPTVCPLTLSLSVRVCLCRLCVSAGLSACLPVSHLLAPKMLCLGLGAGAVLPLSLSLSRSVDPAGRWVRLAGWRAGSSFCGRLSTANTTHGSAVASTSS